MTDPASKVPTTIDEYIKGCPREVQPILQEIRNTVRAAAPDAEERISYRMPCLMQDGPLVYFAAFKKHIGFYPPVKGDAKLMADTSRYANEKGNLRFPLDEPMPHALIRRVVKARLKENQELARSRRAKR